MKRYKINADGANWSVPNPEAGQSPLTLAGYRGEVHEIPDAEAKRLKWIRVRVYYTDPVTGRANGAFREEPAIVDASEAEAQTAEQEDAARQRVRELEDQLAEARNALPLSQSAPSSRLGQPTPAVTGPRDLGAIGTDEGDDAPRPVTDSATDTRRSRPASGR